MKNYNLDKLNNRIPSVGKPDKMGNLPKYPRFDDKESYRPINAKPSARENLTSPHSLTPSALSSAISEAEKLIRG